MAPATTPRGSRCRCTNLLRLCSRNPSAAPAGSVPAGSCSTATHPADHHSADRQHGDGQRILHPHSETPAAPKETPANTAPSQPHPPPTPMGRCWHFTVSLGISPNEPRPLITLPIVLSFHIPCAHRPLCCHPMLMTATERLQRDLRLVVNARSKYLARCWQFGADDSTEGTEESGVFRTQEPQHSGWI